MLASKVNLQVLLVQRFVENVQKDNFKMKARKSAVSYVTEENTNVRYIFINFSEC